MIQVKDKDGKPLFLMVSHISAFGPIDMRPMSDLKSWVELDGDTDGTYSLQTDVDELRRLIQGAIAPKPQSSGIEYL